MGEKTIHLSRSYEAHGKVFDMVVLREPKLRDHIKIGDPIEVHRGPDGQGAFVVEHHDRVEAYLQRLAVAPAYADLQDLDVEDSLAVVEAVTGFFTEAQQRRTARMSSSGATAGSSATSST